MPLVRKPQSPLPASRPEPSKASSSLTSATQDERWAAARAAVDIAGGGAALVAALPVEKDARVREAMFTSLARIGTPETVEAVITLLRSDDANLRTGALDALRIIVGHTRDVLPRLLSDPDVDVRILSCELARVLSSTEATMIMCGLLAREREVNVCAAAVDVLAEVGNVDALPALDACAKRFRDSPFLIFAIEVVVDRISSMSNRA